MESKGVNEISYGMPFERLPILAVMSIGKRIKDVRVALGLRQGELAKAAGIAQSTLSDLERGDSERPRGDSLIQLARVLRVDHDWLMTGQGLPTPRAQPDIDAGHLLAIFEELSDSARATLLGIARTLLEHQPEALPRERSRGERRKHHQ